MFPSVALFGAHSSAKNTIVLPLLPAQKDARGQQLLDEEEQNPAAFRAGDLLA